MQMSFSLNYMVHRKGHPINSSRLPNFWPHSYSPTLPPPFLHHRTEALPLLFADHLNFTIMSAHSVPKAEQLSLITSKLLHALVHSGHLLLRSSNILRWYKKIKKNKQQGCTLI